MHEIRFIKASDREDDYAPDQEDDYSLSVDGTLVQNAYVFKYNEEFSAHLHDYDDSARLASHSFADLPSEMNRIELSWDFEWNLEVEEVRIDRLGDVNSFQIAFRFEFSYEDWKEVYSFSEYAAAFSKAVKNLTDVTYDADSDALANGFWVMFIVHSPEGSIAEKISTLSKALRNLNDQVLTTLKSETAGNTVVVSFDFPEEVRVPCEQYLLYFVQFLKDLGVDATADLRHEAEHVLFSVTPSDKDTALDNIRVALQTYLELASSPIDNSSIVEQEIAAQRLAANVDHLKGQLRLVHAENALKEATIQAQQITINTLLSGEVMLQSMKDVTPKVTATEAPEQLLGGTVALTKFDKYGVQVNLGEILRKLRRRFFPEKN